MNKKQIELKSHYQALLSALGEMLKDTITSATYEVLNLKAEVTGTVVLVSGLATSEAGLESNYKLVLKRLEPWERYADPLSWRREYDLYQAKLDPLMTDSFRWPTCYFQEDFGEELYLWMEYIEGTTNEDLTLDMYVESAKALGEFQGQLYRDHTTQLSSIKNLSQKDFVKQSYLHIRSWDKVYDYVREDSCPLPKAIKEMLIDNDNDAQSIWTGIEQLPVVFCHRDYWITNIFRQDKSIIAIDWDTCGWGYLGEDIASLIADEVPPNLIGQCFDRCIAAYYEGISVYMDTSGIDKHYIKEHILMLYGYRLVAGYRFAESDDEKQIALKTLEAICAIKE